MVPGGSTAGGALQGRPSRGKIPRKTGAPAGHLCPRGGSSRCLFYLPSAIDTGAIRIEDGEKRKS
jgi:hypothetical protein